MLEIQCFASAATVLAGPQPARPPRQFSKTGENGNATGAVPTRAGKTKNAYITDAGLRKFTAVF
jgi:hypothetical protein